jgi:hypothetical protein
MKCWVCQRQARGFGHLDSRYRIADPRRYPLDWVFCSRRCQDIFHTLYGRRLAAEERGETRMVDASEIEIAAMRDCLKAFGSAAAQIGFDKPLGVYSEAEAMTVIDAIVTRYTEALTEHHEQVNTPPLRGVSPDEAVRDPFADLQDDLPWEDGKEVKR